MSSEQHLPTRETNADEPCVVAFGDPVEHDAGVRDREHIVDGVRWAAVEYAPGAGREGWCTQPHMGYLVSGELEYSFEDGRPPMRLTQGDAFALPARPGHAGRNQGNEPARLFIIDALV
jgi:quercetin dioxygenase-like cupin family protein